MAKSFEAALKNEFTLILQDPAFVRSPVQSKLLQYLGEQTLAGTKDLSQYAIAVDGLDRPEDYDMASDSYPRVQISRLRKNLANYYARNEPADEGCIFLRPGDYKLHLASRDVAYPKASKFAEAETSDAVGQLDPIINPQETLQVSETLALARNDAVDRQVVKPPRRWRKTALFGAGAATVAALNFLVGMQLDTPRQVSGPPLVALNLTVGDAVEDLTDLEASADRMARIQLANSFVSRLAPEGAESNAEYGLTINIGENIEGKLEAYIALKDTDNRVLFSEKALRYRDNATFLTDIETNLAYLTSPTGVVAKKEMQSLPARPDSDFGCFLKIESMRANGDQVDGLVNECLARFSDSSYASIWLARQGLTYFQQKIIAGEPIKREGPGWKALQASLDANRDNAFANIVTAKVELVLGNCLRANSYLKRSITRGATYPALVASAVADGASCPENDNLRARNRDYVISLAINNPDPDPLLHLYLTLAVLSLDRPDVAREMAKSSKIETPITSVEIVSQFLRKRLLNERFSNADQQEFEKELALFIWNKPGRDDLLSKLEKAANADG